MELIVKSFSLLNLKDNEIYLLGDFNINLLQNGNYILNRKGLAACKGPVHTLINKYLEFLSNIFFKDTHRGKPNRHTTSNPHRFDVDITSIRRRPNFDEFPRHFRVLFRCNFDSRKIHVEIQFKNPHLQ